MTPRRIVFWEPSLSPHKLPLFRALAARGFDMTYVAQEGLPADRAALGWATGSLDGLDIRVAPGSTEVAALVGDAPDETLHLFSGLRHTPVIVAALPLALRSQAMIGIMSEPRSAAGLAGLIRRAQSLLTEGPLRRRAFVLAIGRNGPPWFRGTGYPAARVFPFAYYLDALPAAPRLPNPVPTIGYLGRLTRAKGLPLFLAAVDRLETPVRVLVAGRGEEADRVARHPGIDFRGGLDMTQVPGFLGELDLLVQPSIEKDGWGAVVGEALLAGAAAVATTHVGASILLDDPRRGAVAERPDAESLVSAITAVLNGGMLDARAERIVWANRTLTGEAGAERLVAILDHLAGNRPAPPFPPA